MEESDWNSRKGPCKHEARDSWAHRMLSFGFRALSFCVLGFEGFATRASPSGDGIKTTAAVLQVRVDPRRQLP